jgi:hypothetical protein
MALQQLQWLDADLQSSGVDQDSTGEPSFILPRASVQNGTKPHHHPQEQPSVKEIMMAVQTKSTVMVIKSTTSIDLPSSGFV